MEKEKKLIMEYLEQIEIQNIYCFERYVQFILKHSLHDKLYIDYYWYIWNALDRWWWSDQSFDNLNKNWPKIISLILQYKRPGKDGRPKSDIIKNITSEVTLLLFN